VKLVGSSAIAELKGGPAGIQLVLDIRFYASGASRVRVTEKNPLNGPRWEVPMNDVLIERTMVPAGHVRQLDSNDKLMPTALKQLAPEQIMAFAYSAEEQSEGNESTILVIHLSPFKVEFYTDTASGAPGVDSPAVVVGGDGLFHFEHHRRKGDQVVTMSAEAEADVHGGKTIADYGEDGLAIYADGTKQAKHAASAVSNHGDSDSEWEEYFHEHRDSKPIGPSSVGMDVTFPRSSHLFGLPSHTTPSNLPSTKGPGARYNEPYRMYTLDVFEYELDNTMALYGGIPMVLAHSVHPTASATDGSAGTRTVGAFWHNPTETYVDVSRNGGDTQTHWISESGIVDLFLLPGPSPNAVHGQYAALTGGTALPPMFALGYHQCRWNYNDEPDVDMVHGKFEELDIPFDVLWLDIEHTDGKRYFTWDKNKFSTPIPMQERLAATGRQMVTIVDPHIYRTGTSTVPPPPRSSLVHLIQVDIAVALHPIVSHSRVVYRSTWHYSICTVVSKFTQHHCP
jgi:alpha 1,3-glucosidase